MKHDFPLSHFSHQFLLPGSFHFQEFELLMWLLPSYLLLLSFLDFSVLIVTIDFLEWKMEPLVLFHASLNSPKMFVS